MVWMARNISKRHDIRKNNIPGKGAQDLPESKIALHPQSAILNKKVLLGHGFTTLRRRPRCAAMQMLPRMATAKCMKFAGPHLNRYKL